MENFVLTECPNENRAERWNTFLRVSFVSMAWAGSVGPVAASENPKRKVYMPRLIVVSNRAPSPSARERSGGLVVSLDSALRESGGLWFGWSGRVTNTCDAELDLCSTNGFSLATIDLTPAEFEGFYTQCANRALWPLFHGRLDLSRFDDDSYASYRQVTRRFADGIQRLTQHDDLIWVHDYHLFLLGAELRSRGVKAAIGFFLHIPFPPPETLQALPWHKELLAALCTYDVVGLQTESCVRNLQDALTRLPKSTRRTRAPWQPSGDAPDVIAAYPIGIDTKAFARLASSRAAQSYVRQYTANRGDRIWIAGAERLDYTKGLFERFCAFEVLLDELPQLQGHVTLIQIAAPSRETVPEYQDLQYSIEALCGRINGRFSTIDWTPICYINRFFDHTALAALYRVSRVGLLTPLRDGMNLVAKEYVASQDPENPGVLVLSKFAGAANELQDALLVNPHDVREVARAIRMAIRMPLSERRTRWRKMMQHLEKHDVQHWRHRFLDDLGSVAARGSGKGTQAA